MGIGNYYTKKRDKSKDRWDLLDLNIIQTIVKILTYGAKKYTANSWQNLPGARARYYAALMRHMKAYRAGQRLDSESKKPHIWHAFCNVYFLVWFDLKDKGCNDKR